MGGKDDEKDEEKEKEETEEEKRHKAMVRYITPYSSCYLSQMAVSFDTDIDKLENELSTLILNGKIKGAIDSYNKVLLIQTVDKRNDVFEKISEMAKDYEKMAKLLALRFTLL